MIQERNFNPPLTTFCKKMKEFSIFITLIDEYFSSSLLFLQISSSVIFFRFHWTECITQNPLEGQTSLLQLWVCREQRTMPSTYELHLVSTRGSWPQTWSFHGSHSWEAQLVGWGGGWGWLCFIPETPVSWILGTCIRFYKVEKVLFSGLLTSSQCIWGKTVHWL